MFVVNITYLFKKIFAFISKTKSKNLSLRYVIYATLVPFSGYYKYFTFEIILNKFRAYFKLILTKIYIFEIIVNLTLITENYNVPFDRKFNPNILLEISLLTKLKKKN